jgi:hypothetical protein
MVSDSTFTDRRRKMKRHKKGQARKRKLRAQGSTQSFSIEPK